jgi:Tfp pilus assembly protein FimV
MRAGAGLGFSFIGRSVKTWSVARRAWCGSMFVILAVVRPAVAQVPVQEASAAPVAATSSVTAPVISPQAQAALSQLLRVPSSTPAPAGVARAAPVPLSVGPAAGQVSSGPAGARMQVVVRPGETLDRVIQRTLRDSPYRVELLRDAFVRLNRSAFPRGTPHWLMAGAVLQVPTAADLMSQVDPRWWPAATQAEPAHASSPQTDRRNWVRYP